MRWTRRHLLQSLAAGTGLAAAGGVGLRARATKDDGPRFLITFGCFGGASMLDCFMPVDVNRALTVPGRGTVIGYDTVLDESSGIRSVNRDTPVGFLSSYGSQMVVMGTQSSSVNHFTAQHRSITGRDTFAGRTLAEAVAAVHGTSMAIPNVNMGRGGFVQPGIDGTLEDRYRSEIVTNPVIWPLSTSGWKGLLPEGELAMQDPELAEALIAQARAVRDDTLETVSPFGQTFAASQRRQQLMYARGEAGRQLEVDDLIQQLLFVPDLGDAFPLNDYGLEPSEETSRILDYLPDCFPQDTSGTPEDRLQAQAALSYLLLRSGTSAAVTLSDPGTDGFLAFDNSHTDHRTAQQEHWDRVLDVADRLIQLLQSAEYGDTGTSLWDRSMVVFATEFGRDKWDTGGSFGTGHHLNNGLLVVSPLVHGGQSLGRADSDNGFICGFDAESGEPTPFDDVTPGEDPLFDDERLPPAEEPVFGTLAAALGIGFDGQETLPVVLDGPSGG